MVIFRGPDVDIRGAMLVGGSWIGEHDRRLVIKLDLFNRHDGRLIPLEPVLVAEDRTEGVVEKFLHLEPQSLEALAPVPIPWAARSPVPVAEIGRASCRERVE